MHVYWKQLLFNRRVTVLDVSKSIVLSYTSIYRIAASDHYSDRIQSFLRMIRVTISRTFSLTRMSAQLSIHYAS